MLKGEPLQSPGLTNRYLLIYFKRCRRQGAREPARGWTLFQSKNTDWLWTSNLPLPNLLSYCACGKMFTVNHALSCKEGGFVAQRHDTIRDLLTPHISKVCRNVETEPLLHPLDNEVFNLQSTVTSRGARLDMEAGGFCTPGVTAFFDVRVTHVTPGPTKASTQLRSSKSKKTRRGNTTKEWWV